MRMLYFTAFCFLSTYINNPLSHCSPSTSLWIEAEVMTRASCDCVLRLYGTYKGFPPIEGDPVQRRRGGEPMQEGLVMAFMERGSLQSLFDKLHDPLLWPLVCRLAHQVAVGMNFLHQQDLMHGDLKPCNVLLDDHFNAKVEYTLCSGQL